MKIQCKVCERAEARVVCWADEAALCDACDEEVHAANKLASQHKRLPLSLSSHSPICDICQDAVGYFFCLEDRALLCRRCDIAIHTANSLVSAHQRFLFTGVKVGLQPTQPASHYAPRPTEPCYDAPGSPQNDTRMPMSMSEYAKMQPVQNGTLDDLTQSRTTFAGGSNTGGGHLSQWPLEDFLGITDFQHNYTFAGNASSKADSGKLGSSDSSAFLRSLEFGLDSEDQLGQVPDVSWAVPQIHSPPTASGIGIYWPQRSHQQLHLAENTPFVPDISGPQSSNCHHNPKHNAGKRRRQS